MTILIRLSGALTLLLFIVTITLIRIQPYDDADLRALFGLDVCAEPCPLGVRPGATAMDTALARLGAHEWVGGIESFPGNLTSVHFIQWSGAQPRFIDTNFDGRVVGIFPRTEVQAVQISTTLTMAQVHLLLGEPLTVEFSPVGTPNTIGVLTTYQAGGRMNVWAQVECPLTLRRFYEARAQFEFSALAGDLSGHRRWQRRLRANWC